MSLTAISAATVLLSTFVPKKTLLVRTYAYSEQTPAVSVGSNPCELVLHKTKATQPILSEPLRALGETQAGKILELLGEFDVEFEAWPTQNEDGQWTWVFARFRKNAKDAWKWIKLDPTQVEKAFKDQISPALVSVLDLLNPQEQSRVFDDFLTFKDLYQKPLFGDCLWTEDGTSIIAAWLPPDHINMHRKKLTAPGLHLYCYHLPQPARFNAKPITFVVKASLEKTQWPKTIQWVQRDEKQSQLDSWPKYFRRDYRQDVLVFSGEKKATFPISGRKVWFHEKNSADPDHVLELLVDYLEERYKALGIMTGRFSFKWRGIAQSNLVAKIPGSLKGKKNKPIILSAHFDTAFSHDKFSKTGRRIAAPGASDNAVATAVLLKAAQILGHQKLKHDVWLVHLTGEEYPGDCLGARHFVDGLLQSRQEIGGALILDMIGYDINKTGIVQINPGDSHASIRLADLAFHTAKEIAPRLNPLVHLRFDEKSYLYNTDGLIFSDAGYPVILLNEHVNDMEHFNRPHYHQSTDVSKYIDWSYAVAVTKVAIETALRMAQ